MSSGRADEFYSTVNGLMINLEEESKKITETILKKISNYAIFAEFMYSKNLYCAIICHKDPGKKFEYYRRSPSIIIKVHYIYFPQEVLWKKYENLIKKIEQKEQLTIDESLDIAFVPKFISNENGAFVTESLAKLFKSAKIHKEISKRDIGVILGAMILRYFDDEKKINELMEAIEMKQIENEIKIIAREEFKDEFEKVEREKLELQLENAEMKNEYAAIKNENTEMKNEIDNYKRGIKELSQIKDLNSPQAKKLLNSLIIS